MGRKETHNSEQTQDSNSMCLQRTTTVYASKTWTLKATDKRKLLAFDMRCYRRILKIRWKHMIENQDIRKRISKEKTTIDVIKKRKLRPFGHICRTHENRLVKHIVFGKIHGKLRKGRPYREWLDDI